MFPDFLKPISIHYEITEVLHRFIYYAVIFFLQMTDAFFSRRNTLLKFLLFLHIYHTLI